MILDKIIQDTYREHEQHIISNGKKVPFFKNMNECSTCWNEHFKLKDSPSKGDHEALKHLDIHLNKINAPWEFN